MMADSSVRLVEVNESPFLGHRANATEYNARAARVTR